MGKITIFLDTWVWLEFIFRGNKFERTKYILEKIAKKKEKGVISSLVLAEVKFCVERRFGKEIAERVIDDIENFPNLEIVEITAHYARMGANLRARYYKKGKCELSYADCINLAIAIEKCKRFVTGDKEFLKIREKIEIEVL